MNNEALQSAGLVQGVKGLSLNRPHAKTQTSEPFTPYTPHTSSLPPFAEPPDPIAAAKQRAESRRQQRAELRTRRDHGLAKRHQRKLSRKETEMAAKWPQCHYLKAHSLERCTAESVNPNPDVGPMLCTRHMAEVVEFIEINRRIAKAGQQKDTRK